MAATNVGVAFLVVNDDVGVIGDVGVAFLTLLALLAPLKTSAISAHLDISFLNFLVVLLLFSPFTLLLLKLFNVRSNYVA